MPVGDTLRDAMTTDIVACIFIRVGDVLTMPGQRERRMGTGGRNPRKGLTALTKMMEQRCKGRQGRRLTWGTKVLLLPVLRLGAEKGGLRVTWGG